MNERKTIVTIIIFIILAILTAFFHVDKLTEKRQLKAKLNDASKLLVTKNSQIKKLTEELSIRDPNTWVNNEILRLRSYIDNWTAAHAELKNIKNARIEELEFDLAEAREDLKDERKITNDFRLKYGEKRLIDSNDYTVRYSEIEADFEAQLKIVNTRNEAKIEALNLENCGLKAEIARLHNKVDLTAKRSAEAIQSTQKEAKDKITRLQKRLNDSELVSNWWAARREADCNRMKSSSCKGTPLSKLCPVNLGTDAIEFDGRPEIPLPSASGVYSVIVPTKKRIDGELIAICMDVSEDVARDLWMASSIEPVEGFSYIMGTKYVHRNESPGIKYRKVSLAAGYKE